MSSYKPSAATDTHSDEVEELSQLASDRVSGLFSWMGSKLLSALGFVSEALRPLFSWNPGRD